MKHLLKTSKGKVADRRTKGKHYFRLLFAAGRDRLFRFSAARGTLPWTKTVFYDF